MKNNDYEIEYLPSFSNELNNILYYIASKLGNKVAAKKLASNVSSAILARSYSPDSFEVYKTNRRYTWYRIYVNNYTIFYTVTNNTMRVAHIIYSRRDFKNLI